MLVISVVTLTKSLVRLMINMEYFLLGLIQITFNLLKILEIKFSYEQNMKMTIIIGFLLSIVWLFSTAIGVNAVIKLDYVMMGVYIFSSVLGKVLALHLQKKIKVDKLISRKKNKKHD